MDPFVNWDKLRRVWPLWAALALPAVWLVLEKLLTGISGARFFYWTGVLSFLFIVVSLSATPIRRLAPGASLGGWLVRNRRYFGVAGFSYAALHALYWLQLQTLLEILQSFLHLDVLLGWLGFFILTAMALTSNDLSVRRLGRTWKALQRWIYIGAPLALLHWLVVEHFRLKTLVIYGGLLVLVMLARLVVYFRQRAGRVTLASSGR